MPLGVVCRATKISEIALILTNLKGTIPTSIGQLTALQVLGLSSNELTGTIPASIDQLTQLWNLALSSNKLTGSIPPSFVQLKALTHFFLDGNKLSGVVPALDFSTLDCGIGGTNQYACPLPPGAADCYASNPFDVFAFF